MKMKTGDFIDVCDTFCNETLHLNQLQTGQALGVFFFMIVTLYLRQFSIIF